MNRRWRGSGRVIQERRNVSLIRVSWARLHLRDVRSRRNLLFKKELTDAIPGFGDIPFKLPPTFTRRILFNLYPGFKDTTPWEEFLKRNLTPPYVTAEPEIVHRRLDGQLNPLRPLHSTTSVGQKHRIPSSILPHPASQPSNHHPRFLILASDGFTDLCEREGQSVIIESWANGMMLRHPGLGVSDAEETGAKKDNMALRLLRRTIGGEDRGVVGRTLMPDEANAGGGSWIDDTSIVVQTL